MRLLVASAAACAATGWMVLVRQPRLAGIAGVIAAMGLLLGTTAARGARDRRAVFVGLLLDRAFDAAVLAPLAWVLRIRSPGLAVLALVGLAASFVASYERARGRSLGYRGAEPLAYAATREALLIIGLMTGWYAVSLWAFDLVTVAATAARAWSVAGQERRARLTESRL